MQEDNLPEVLTFSQYSKLTVAGKNYYYTSYFHCPNCNADNTYIAMLKGIEVETIKFRYKLPCEACGCILNKKFAHKNAKTLETN